LFDFFWLLSSAIILENSKDNLKLSNEAERKAEVSADRDNNEGVDNKAAEFSEVRKAYTIGSS